MPSPRPGTASWPARAISSGRSDPRHRARAVDVAGADHDRAPPAGEPVGGGLGVDVGDPVGAAEGALVLLARAVVAVDDDRAEVDDAVRARPRAASSTFAVPPTLTRTKSSIVAPLADVGGGVDDQVGAVERRAERLAVGDVGLGEARRRRRRPGPRAAGSTSSPSTSAPSATSAAADRGADEAAGAGDRGPATLEARSPTAARAYTRRALLSDSRAPPFVAALSPGRLRRRRSRGPRARPRRLALAARRGAAAAQAPARSRRPSRSPRPPPARSRSRCCCPRTKARDAALFALQMWAFAIVHELPYDDPERLRRRLRVRYPIRGRPGARRRRAAERPAAARLLAPGRGHHAATASWHGPLGLVLRAAPVAASGSSLRDTDRFPRAARQMAAAYDLGCAVYFAVPTAPPWWAAEKGYSRTSSVGRAEVAARTAALGG